LFHMFRADPPAPVSNKPPPFINGTIDNIFADVPSSRIGINLLNNHVIHFRLLRLYLHLL
jgi:hypothetical protein